MNAANCCYNSRDAEVLVTPPAPLTTPLLRGAGGMAIEQITTSETWRLIPGFPRYEVSDHGRVRSLRWTYIRHEWRHGREQIVHVGGNVLTGWTKHRDGIPQAQMVVVLNEDKKRIEERVHRLVLLAFVGPCPNKMEGCHNDGNPLNNRLANLRWDTHRSNVADSVKHGTKTDPPTFYGQDHHNSKMSDDDVAFVRSFPKRRGNFKMLAERFGVNPQTISRIWKRRSRGGNVA